MISASRLVAGSLLALSATGCLATKGDIRLLQDEVRAARASAARSDSLRKKTADSLAAALASLAASEARTHRDLQTAITRANDSLRALSARANANDLNTREQLRSLNNDVDQLREITRQNARGQALARAQAEAATRQVPGTPDTTASSTPVPSGPPGPATLLVSGRSQIIQGSCTTARRAFQDVVSLYPESAEAPEALFSIAESFVSCGEGGNPTRADSVYKLVTERYPQSDFSATSLYKRAEMLRQANNAAAAKPLYERILCEYRTSTVAPQALNRLGGTRPTCRPASNRPAL